jgi:hypothetical protein
MSAVMRIRDKMMREWHDWFEVGFVLPSPPLHPISIELSVDATF